MIIINVIFVYTNFTNILFYGLPMALILRHLGSNELILFDFIFVASVMEKARSTECLKGAPPILAISLSGGSRPQ